MKLINIALSLLICASGWAETPLQTSQQAVVVKTKDWTTTSGRAQRYERQNGRWRKVGTPTTVAVGRSGLAWGMSEYTIYFNTDYTDTPTKREGDGRAPAGIFRLTTLFSANESAHRYAHMPFIQLSPSIECVDDEKDPEYNTLVDSTKIKTTWDSSEHMLRRDDLYDFGVFVAHNSNPTTAGFGSCIFIHKLGPLGEVFGTSGCTAFPGVDLVRLFNWLDETKHPVLIQMPEREYKSNRKVLGLP